MSVRYDNDRFLYTSVDDPLARPLFDGLEQEYDHRYADVRRRIGGSAREELQRYPAEAFAAPVGAFVLLLSLVTDYQDPRITVGESARQRREPELDNGSRGYAPAARPTGGTREGLRTRR